MFEPVSLDELEQWHHDDIFLILGLGHIRITNDIQTTITYRYPQFDRINLRLHTQVVRVRLEEDCILEDTEKRTSKKKGIRLIGGNFLKVG